MPLPSLPEFALRAPETAEAENSKLDPVWERRFQRMPEDVVLFGGGSG